MSQDDELSAAVNLLNSRGVHINTRDERGVRQPLDAKTIIAIAELVRAYEKTLVGPNGGPYVSASREPPTPLSGGRSETSGDYGIGR